MYYVYVIHLVGVSFAKVGLTALQLGWPVLCNAMLKVEAIPARKVVVQIESNQLDGALKTAVKSRDYNLMFLVLFYIWTYTDSSKPSFLAKHAAFSFYSLIRPHPEICQLFITYCKACERRTLKDCYYKLGRLSEAAILVVNDGCASDNINKRKEKFGII